MRCEICGSKECCAAGMEIHQKQRPLLDEEIEDLAEEFQGGYVFSYLKFARAIEKAHGIGETE